MPAPNRNRYSDDYGGGSTAIRTLGAFLLCAVLSFALGFFVLARFWSSKPKSEADGLDKNTVASAGDRSLSRHADDTPAPLRTSLPAPRSTPRVVAPRIDPAAEDVQKPTVIDANKDTQKTTDPSQDTLPDPSAETQKPAEAAQTDPSPAPENAKPKRHKKVSAPEETQPSKSPGDETVPPDSTDDVNDVRAPRHKRAAAAGVEAGGGLFRVQIGVYSTREKAEEQAKSASDKGFDTTIHTVTTGDHTLYRVQHSAHRNRANAEIEKQRLVDAGFDAYIANK
jgi:cell division protein FtsN